MYKIEYTAIAIKGIAKMQKSEPSSYQKLKKPIEEIRQSPRSGIGHPEQLKGFKRETWSRTISKKHRLVYTIDDDKIIIYVLSAYGHYNDK
jgi:toxin YoeB